MSIRQKSRAQQLQEIINAYLQETGAEEIEMRTVAAWAIRNGLWDVPPRDKVKQCATELSRAAREEYYEDPQGRKVRKKHAYRVKDGLTQGVFWVDIETAKPEQMRLALQQRRKGILQDCHQLKTDQDSFNDNNTHGAKIGLLFDFEEDLAEMEESTEYPEVPPEEEEERGEE